MPRVITARIVGGLGNQIFIYAAARTLATRLGADLCLDVSSYRHDSARAFRLDRLRIEGRVLPSEERAPPFRRATWWTRRFPLMTADNFVLYSEPHFHFDREFMSLSGDIIHLDGYFQSFRYFEMAGDKIASEIQLAETPSAYFESTARSIDACDSAISVHIRRGDYVNDPRASAVHNSIGVGYYNRAITIAQQLFGPRPQFFFFSDDPDYVRTHFSHIATAVVLPCSVDSPEEDLFLMARCKHNIIANSTFSWWAAWLNRNPTKVVVAPAQWFTPEHQLTKNPMDLFPHGWILMP